MRLVKVQAPQGQADAVAQVAFDVGISQVTIRQEQICRTNQEKEVKDVVDLDVSTPEAKAFIGALTAEPFFDREHYSISVRQPRSIFSRRDLKDLTRPLAQPTVDILQELWQFSHVTVGFAGRVFIASLLLGYGMLQDKLLLIIAGMLFMPLLPLLLGISFGASTRQWRLVGQSALALVVGTGLTVAGAALVARLMGGHLQFNDFAPLHVSFLISLVVGIAGGLATGDEAGERELIGLAATSQLALLAAWFGIWLVLGAEAVGGASPAQRGLTWLVNASTIVGAALATYAVLGMRGAGLTRPKQASGPKPSPQASS
jgi:hypothetical protein